METRYLTKKQGDKTMNIETVANQSDVNKIIFEALAQRQRAIKVTSLTNLYRALHKKHPEIPEKEVIQVFRQLENADFGKLIIGRRNNHNRFVWNHNLKDVAGMAIGKVTELRPAPKVRGKRSRRINKLLSQTATVKQELAKHVAPVPVQDTKSSTITGPRFQFDIQLSPTVSAADIQALVELVQSLQNK